MYRDKSHAHVFIPNRTHCITLRNTAVKHLRCAFDKPFRIKCSLRYSNKNITTNTNRSIDNALACCTKVSERLQHHRVSPALWKNNLRHTSTYQNTGQLLLSVHPICFTRLSWRTSAHDTTSHEPNTFCNMHSYQQNHVSTERHSRYVRINRLDSHHVARRQLDTHLQTMEKQQSETYK